MDATLFGLSAVPLILALVQLAKTVGLPAQYAPLLALLLGVAAGVGIQSTLVHPVWVQGVVIGIAIGLSASGLYSHATTYAFHSLDSAPTPDTAIPSGHALALIPLAPQDVTPPPASAPDVVAAPAEGPHSG